MNTTGNWFRADGRTAPSFRAPSGFRVPFAAFAAFASFGWVLLLALIGASTIAAFGQGPLRAEGTTDVKALEAQLNAISKQKMELRESFRNLPEVQAKQSEFGEALHEYNLAVDDHPVVQETFRRSEQKRKDLWRRTVEKSMLETNIVAMVNRIELTEGQIRMARWGIAVAELKLNHPHSPINQALDEDPRLVALEKGEEPPDTTDEVKAWMMERPVKEVRAAIKSQMPEVEKLEAEIESAKAFLKADTKTLIGTKGDLWKAREAMFSGGDEELTAMRKELSKSVDVFRDSFFLPELIALDKRKKKLKAEVDELLNDILASDTRGKELVARESELRDVHRTELQRLIEVQQKNLKR